MNNLKFGVLACGVIGVIAVFLPWISFGEMSASLWKARSGPEGGQVYLIMGAFAIAAVMGGLAVAKAPMQRWQGVVALLGFALVVFKLREALPMDFMKAPGGIGMKLIGLSSIVGAVISVLTLAKPETAR